MSALNEVKSFHELAGLFVENTQKLGACAAAIGLAGDESVKDTEARAAAFTAAHGRLLQASAALVAAAQPSMAGYLIPAPVLEALHATTKEFR